MLIVELWKGLALSACIALGFLLTWLRAEPAPNAIEWIGPAIAVAVPLIMDFQLRSPDPKYRHDFFFGAGWYLLALVSIAVFTPAGNRALWLFMSPLLLAMFAFGVVHHHTSIIDLMQGGVAAGWKHVKHPRRTFLGICMLSMFVVPMIGFLAANLYSSS